MKTDSPNEAVHREAVVIGIGTILAARRNHAARAGELQSKQYGERYAPNSTGVLFGVLDCGIIRLYSVIPDEDAVRRS